MMRFLCRWFYLISSAQGDLRQIFIGIIVSSQTALIALRCMRITYVQRWPLATCRHHKQTLEGVATSNQGWLEEGMEQNSPILTIEMSLVTSFASYSFRWYSQRAWRGMEGRVSHQEQRWADPGVFYDLTYVLRLPKEGRKAQCRQSGPRSALCYLKHTWLAIRVPWCQPVFSHLLSNQPPPCPSYPSLSTLREWEPFWSLIHCITSACYTGINQLPSLLNITHLHNHCPSSMKQTNVRLDILFVKVCFVFFPCRLQPGRISFQSETSSMLSPIKSLSILSSLINILFDDIHLKKRKQLPGPENLQVERMNPSYTFFIHFRMFFSLLLHFRNDR